MADRLNPAEQTAAESDYQKKFNRTEQTADPQSKSLKDQEASGGDAAWKTTTKGKKKAEQTKKGRFGFAGRRAGKLRHASAFGFIISLILMGVWYTSVFAPNILMVNIKEMYTNDLSDATIALNSYYWKMMNYKIGRANCGEQKSIKCRLSTMSRAQKQAFEKNGFTVIGTKVKEDNLDDGQPGNDQPEERYQVTAILPPKYKETIDEIKNTGLSWLSGGMNGGIKNLSTQFQNISQNEIKKYTDDFMSNMPIATGDMLWLYSQLSSGTKAQVYGVFNPKSSFFMDTRFKQVLKNRYGLTKSLTVSGTSEQAVNKSFDSSVNNSSGGIDISGRPDPLNGISLGSLRNPVTAAKVLAAAEALALNSNSYTQLECNWYSFAKAITNDAKSAKSATIARFAMQYLKMADAIKAGQADELPANVLSSKLAQSTTGGYNGQNATDSSMYKSIVYGNLPIPSIYGLLYYLDSFEIIGALFPAWTMLMASATGLAGVTNAPGTLSMPPGNLTGSDRDYCLSGETTENKSAIKPGDSKTTKCIEAINAMAFPGTQPLVADATVVAGQTCPPPHYDNPDNTFEGEFLMQPSARIVQAQLTPVIAGIFGTNVIAWAAAESLLFTSQTKGVAASDALFAGTGQILGDMAMSRGMEPANAVTLGIYFAQRDKVMKDFDDVARHNARKNPLDPYNKFSFLGSIVRSLQPSYDHKTPLLSTVTNIFSTVGSGIRQLNPSAKAVYYLQPDPFNPLRLSCPDPEYLAIGIMADTACNVRYAMGKQELLAQPDSVLDYMTKAHNDLTQDNITELQQRLAKADDEGDRENVARMLANAQQGANSPQIDKVTGKAMPNTEYEKFLDYCVNRQDPWGRSAVAVHRSSLPDAEKLRRWKDKTGDIEGVSPSDSGNPYEETPGIPYASIMEGAKADQDWYTGKKCLEQSEELMNFRAYTMLCSVDGSLSGGVDCTDPDHSTIAAYSDQFYTSNDILYMSWY